MSYDLNESPLRFTDRARANCKERRRMTHDETIKKWHDQLPIDSQARNDEVYREGVELFRALCRMVAADEREACAKVADTIDLMPITEKGMSIDGQIAQAWLAGNIANSIRKRGVK